MHETVQRTSWKSEGTPSWIMIQALNPWRGASNPDAVEAFDGEVRNFTPVAFQNHGMIKQLTPSGRVYL
jgi:hypothetical protein